MGETFHPDATQVVCASVVLDDEGALLLVRESKKSAFGRWSLPAGRLHVGESLREGAAREALEETGLTVQVGSLLGIYHCPLTLEGGSAVVFVFRSTVVSGDLRPSPEHPEVAFVPRAVVHELIQKSQIRGQHVRHALAAAEAGTELPPDIVVEVRASPNPMSSERSG